MCGIYKGGLVGKGNEKKKQRGVGSGGDRGGRRGVVFNTGDHFAALAPTLALFFLSGLFDSARSRLAEDPPIEMDLLLRSPIIV